MILVERLYGELFDTLSINLFLCENTAQHSIDSPKI